MSGEGSPGGKSEGYASSSSFQKSEVVPSDAEGAEDLLKGFAQRVEDPDVRETRAKGKLVTVQQQGKTARSYYTNEPAFLELVGKQGWSDGQGAKPSVAAERKIDADIDAAFAETDGNKTDEKHRRDGSRRKASDDMSGGSDEERAKDEAKEARSGSEEAPAALATADEAKAPKAEADVATHPPATEPSSDDHASPAPAPERSAPPSRASTGGSSRHRAERSSSRGKGRTHPPKPTDQDHPYYSDAASLSSGVEGLERHVTGAGDNPENRPGNGGLRPFHKEQFLGELSRYTEQTVLANRARRTGNHPAAMGIADDLPDKVVYENLLSLQGMTAKVSEVIAANELMFRRRLQEEDHGLRLKVWEAWRERVRETQATEARVRKAMNRVLRGCLARTFYAWRDEFHLTDNSWQLKKKLQATHARGKLERVMRAWWDLVEERRFGSVVEAAQQQQRASERYVERLRRRAVLVMQRRKLAPAFYAWARETEEESRRRAAAESFFARYQKQTTLKALLRWKEYTTERKEKRAVALHAANIIRNRCLARCFYAMAEHVYIARDEKAKQARALNHLRNRGQARAFNAWAAWIYSRRLKKQAATMWTKNCLARAMRTWLDGIDEQQRTARLMDRSRARFQHRLLSKAFSKWAEITEECRGMAEDERVAHLEGDHARLRDESARLRRDNERFQRIIDSGEWGRGRVEELANAGEAMRAERDAMLQLVAVLRSEFDALQASKADQDEEIRALKDRFMTTGHSRNMMLVRGGSSFNSMVRAMKQGLLDQGRGDPRGRAPGEGTSGRSTPAPLPEGGYLPAGAGEAYGQARLPPERHAGPLSGRSASAGRGTAGRPGLGDRGPGGGSRVLQGSAPRVRDPNLLFEVDRLALDRVAIFPDGELKVAAVPGAVSAPIRPTAQLHREGGLPRPRPGSARPPRPAGGGGGWREGDTLYPAGLGDPAPGRQ